MPWFSFENVHVSCFRQNKIKSIFYSTVKLCFLFLDYALKIPKLPIHRPFILQKFVQYRSLENVMLNSKSVTEIINKLPDNLNGPVLPYRMISF